MAAELFDYATEVRLFRYLLAALAQMATGVVPDLGGEQNYPELLLTLRTLGLSTSVMKLIGDTEPDPKATLYVPAIATLARSAVESSVSFFFTCADQVSDEEKELRRLVGMHHYASELARLGRDFALDETELAAHRALAESIRARLEVHPFLNQLTTPARKRALSGEASTYLSRREQSQRMGVPPGFMAAIYRVLSGYTHASPLSLHMDVSRYKDPQSREREVASMLFYVNVILAHHGLGLLRLFAPRDLPCPNDYRELATAVSKRNAGASFYEGRSVK